MKHIFILSVISVMLILSSCASTMPGKNLNLSSIYLGASLAVNPDYSDDKIKMYQISVQNNSSIWIEMDSVLIGKNTKTATILVGDRISSWIEACALEKKVLDHNLSLLLGTAAVGGAVIGATSSSHTTSNVGFTLSLGAITAAGLKEVMESKNKTQFQEAFPEGHIFNPFVIPPKKVIQRWILVENPDHEDVLMTLKSKTKEVGEVSFFLK